MKTTYKDQKVITVRKGYVGAYVNVNGQMKFVVMKKADHKEIKYKSQTVTPKDKLWVK